MTPADKAAAIAADPHWRFASDPVNAVSAVSVLAADARNGTSVQPVDILTSRFWVEVGIELVRLADNPHVRVGEVLRNLALEYHIPV